MGADLNLWAVEMSKSVSGALHCCRTCSNWSETASNLDCHVSLGWNIRRRSSSWSRRLWRIRLWCTSLRLLSVSALLLNASCYCDWATSQPRNRPASSAIEGGPSHEDDVLSCCTLCPWGGRGNGRLCEDVAHKSRDGPKRSPGRTSGG